MDGSQQKERSLECSVSDWTATEYGRSPLPPNGSEASLVLPLVLKEFTTPAVSVLGLSVNIFFFLTFLSSLVIIQTMRGLGAL